MTVTGCGEGVRLDLGCRSPRARSRPGASSSQPVAVGVPRIHVRSQQLQRETRAIPAASAMLSDRAAHAGRTSSITAVGRLQLLCFDPQDQPDGNVRRVAANASGARPTSTDGITLSGDFTLDHERARQLWQHEHCRRRRRPSIAADLVANSSHQPTGVVHRRRWCTLAGRVLQHLRESQRRPSLEVRGRHRPRRRRRRAPAHTTGKMAFVNSAANNFASTGRRRAVRAVDGLQERVRHRLQLARSSGCSASGTHALNRCSGKRSTSSSAARAHRISSSPC